MLIIPTYIEEMDIPAEEKLRLGKEFTDKAMVGSIEVKEELPVDDKREDWKDPDVGILVGANNSKTHRLKGGAFILFQQMYIAYGHKDSPKRPAAWSFVKTIMPHLKTLETKTAKNDFAAKLIQAAKTQCIKNQEILAGGSSVKHLQGWITEQRYESYM